jgi:hypothetical protein
MQEIPCIQELHNETRAVETLEVHLQTYLDFGGIDTDIAATGMRRAAKGGMLQGEHLLAIVQLCGGAQRLQAALRAAKATAAGSRHAASVNVLADRYALVATMRTYSLLEARSPEGTPPSSIQSSQHPTLGCSKVPAAAWMHPVCLARYLC